VQIRKVDSLLHGHPRAVLALARASAHLGDTTASLAALERIVRMGWFTTSPPIPSSSRSAVTAVRWRSPGVSPPMPLPPGVSA